LGPESGPEREIWEPSSGLGPGPKRAGRAGGVFRLVSGSGSGSARGIWLPGSGPGWKPPCLPVGRWVYTDIAIVAALTRAPLHTHFCRAKFWYCFGFAFVALRSSSSSVASF
jgi:hypothetical protein